MSAISGPRSGLVLALGALVLLTGLAAGLLTDVDRAEAQESEHYPIHPIIIIPCATPLPSGATPVPRPTPTPGGGASSATYRVCPRMSTRIPAAIQAQALAEPWSIAGYGRLLNPNKPYHPLWNTYRSSLMLRNPNVPYSICNTAVWKAGCQ